MMDYVSCWIRSVKFEVCAAGSWWSFHEIFSISTDSSAVSLIVEFRNADIIDVLKWKP